MTIATYLMLRRTLEDSVSVSAEVDDPVMEVALHLSKTVKQPQPSNQPE